MRFRRKPLEISAVELQWPMTLEVDPKTIERGSPGDYLLTFEGGGHRFMTKAEFDRDYEPVDGTAPAPASAPATGAATILDHG